MNAAVLSAAKCKALARPTRWRRLRFAYPGARSRRPARAASGLRCCWSGATNGNVWWAMSGRGAHSWVLSGSGEDGRGPRWMR